jgi:hypothetical protein
MATRKKFERKICLVGALLHNTSMLDARYTRILRFGSLRTCLYGSKIKEERYLVTFK